MNFWKKLFKKEEEKEEVDFFELSTWILQNYGLLKLIDTTFIDLRTTLQNLEKDILKLEHLDVNTLKVKVEGKLETMLQGNKPAYIKSVQVVLKKLQVPEKYDSKTLCSFVETTEGILKDFNKRTTKNYYVLQSVIGDELVAIVTHIKKIDTLNAILKKEICAGQLLAMESFQNHLTKVYLAIEGKQEEDKHLLHLQKQHEKLLASQDTLMKDLDSHKNGKPFHEYSELQKEKNLLVQKEYDVRAVFEGNFSVLKRPLRKLHKMDHLPYISKYLDAPYDAFVNDKDLKLLTILKSLRSALEKEKIKEKNQEKVLGILKALSEKSLQDYQKTMKIFLEKISLVEKRLIKNTFQKDEIKYHQELASLGNKLGDIDQEISKLKDKDLSKDILKIRESLKKLDIHIVLKNAPLD